MRVEFGDDCGINWKAGLVFAGFAALEGIGKVVGQQDFLAQGIQKEQIEDLTEKLETRKWVERAKGILMDRHGLSEQDAFMRIHKQARNTNRKMRDVAESIVEAYKVIE